MIVKSILTTILFVTFLSSTAFARKWTDVSGTFSVEAEFVEAKNDSVILKKVSGEQIKVPLEKLSQTDREYVKLKKSTTVPSPKKESPAASAPNSSVIVEYPPLIVPNLPAKPNDLDKIPPKHGDFRLYLNSLEVAKSTPYSIHKSKTMLEIEKQSKVPAEAWIPVINSEASDMTTWSGQSPFALTAKELELWLQMSIDTTEFDPIDIVASVTQDKTEIASVQIQVTKDSLKHTDKRRRVQFLLRTPLNDIAIQKGSKLAISFNRSAGPSTSNVSFWGLGDSHLEFRDKRSSPENFQTTFGLMAVVLPK